MIAVIDNYDSFVYNLVQYLLEMADDVRVFRNDKITVKELDSQKPHAIILSPGPCTPLEAGICVETVRELGSKYPILGVCLGHQSIAAAFNGNIVRAPKLVHGKTSKIYHDSKTIFKGMDKPFTATRYHSLIVEKESLPACFSISAETADGIIMGIRHKELPLEGVQFHPESILTNNGKQLLKNFINLL